VESPLGEGGMATVYRVHSALSERVVGALKVMKPSIGGDARARFVREAEALSALRHPGIVHVMGFSEDADRGLLYLVMELAVGETLKSRLERGPLSIGEALATCTPLAGALEHAHAEGIFHRDIKPANIVLCEDGTVRLVDFGIASAYQAETLTTTGHIGTVSYLPPEIFRGLSPDPEKLDVYSFGLVHYEALVGERPYPIGEGLTPAAAAAAVGVRKLQHGSMDPGDAFPDGLRHIIRRATDPEPSGRPTMHGLHEALRIMPRPAVTPGGAHVGPARRRSPHGSEEERTTRVPDPPRPRAVAAAATSSGNTGTAEARRRGRDRRRREDPKWWLGWAAAGVLVIVLAMLLFSDRTRDPTASASPSPTPSTRPAHAPAGRPSAASRPRRPASPDAAATDLQDQPRESAAPSTIPAPSPRAIVGASPSTPPLKRPVGTVPSTPTPLPMPTPTPQPSASATPTAPTRVIVRPMIEASPRPGAVPIQENEASPSPSPSPPAPVARPEGTPRTR
jgi:serine/threonine protein kinase